MLEGCGMVKGAAAAVDSVDTGLIDLQSCDLDMVKALLDDAPGLQGSVLDESIRRVWREAKTAGDAAAGFNSSL
jgi:FXSXX-COOH protein